MPADKDPVAAELDALERKHRFNYEVRRLVGPMLPNGIISIARQLLEENRRLRQEAEGLTGPHGMDPERCPTFHDGCHCTVENLVHNIDRAEAAEALISQVRKALMKAQGKAFNVGPGCRRLVKERHLAAVLALLPDQT
ncbi:MAG: hypothetical protein GY838_12975 [bacterium]|nr:hypothetical protein [bacterium]